MRLESAELTVVVEAVGGRITSLLHRPSGREWLQPPRAGPCSTTDFLTGPMGGWDEMFPTIDACRHPLDGCPLPDHGELWSRAWLSGVHTASVLELSVIAPLTGATLWRRLALDGPRLTISYALSATRDVVALWAAHPQFRALAGTRVVLPSGTPLVDVGGGTASPVGNAGPPAVHDLPRGTSRKLYVDPVQVVDRVSLQDTAGPSLTLAWDGRELPYLAVWLDHAGCADAPVVGLEPTSGYFDALDRAYANGRVLVLQAGEVRHWELTVTLTGGIASSRPSTASVPAATTDSTSRRSGNAW